MIINLSIDEDTIERIAQRTAKIVLEDQKENEVWLTQKEAAEYSGLTTATIINREKKGLITFKRDGSTARYLKSTLTKKPTAVTVG
jgi:predicted transcriptional regulator